MDEQQVEDIVKCSDCGSRSLSRDETRGEVVCDDCGLVTKAPNGVSFLPNKATSVLVPVHP